MKVECLVMMSAPKEVELGGMTGSLLIEEGKGDGAIVTQQYVNPAHYY